MGERICSVVDCERGWYSRGVCKFHYQRARNGDATIALAPANRGGKPCSVLGCERPVHAHSACGVHYVYWKNGRIEVPGQRPAVARACSVERCVNRAYQKTWCEMHYTRWRKHGDINHQFTPGRNRGRAKNTPPGDCVHCGAARVRSRETGRLVPCGPCANRRARDLRALDPSRHREYQKSRREQRNKTSREWFAARPDHRRMYSGQRRAREVEAICQHGPTCVTPDDLRAVRLGRCVYCGDPARHADHDIPLARGGMHCRDNLVPACVSCNVQKHTMTGDEWVAKRAERATV